MESPVTIAPDRKSQPRLRDWPVGTLLLSWFGLGLLGPAPGTLGSLGALPVAALLAWGFGAWALGAAAIIAFAIGWRVAAIYLRRTADAAHDPQWIVIDEVAAQWAVLAVVPLSVPWYACGFVLFRLFDITKPWPVSWADRSVPGALGIMLDDMLAAVYAAIILVGARIVWG